MKTATSLLMALAMAATAVATTAAQAADVGQHPAVFSPRSLPGIDPSTFIVGHPARGAAGRAETVQDKARVAAPALAPAAAQADTRISSAQDKDTAAATVRQ